tara:strand:- start:2032 stop:2571 length:540 start_codon:yes stop_codon:yes gene_type:complete
MANSIYYSLESVAHGQAFDEVVVEADKDYSLGQIVRAVDGYTTTVGGVTATNYGAGEFIYLKGVASTVEGSVVLYNPDDYTTSLATANDVGPIAVAMAACVADRFGWYQISGKGVAKVLASFADNGDCYLTSTAGSVDDADVGGDYIAGMKGASAIGTPSAGLAEVELWRPSVADGKDD